ncbi:RICIN domain-containing protein [Streptomyces sp. NPDC088254]|uniref:RICIN domain-containing protein n=1 Tax=Streptomyces sp. NPDC088254 TaxID=3365847 RepID=UPI00380898B8
MNLTRVRKFTGSAVALVGMAAGFGVLQPTSAQAAPQASTYWKFLNNFHHENQCLTGGRVNDNGSGRAFMSSCSDSQYQQWDWRGTDSTDPKFVQLQNRATGLCLATDNISDINTVWTSKCEWRSGMRFRYDYRSGGGGDLCVNIKKSNGDYSCLHVASTGAVYSGYSDGNWSGVR